MSLTKAPVLGALAVAILAATGWFLATKNHAAEEPPPASSIPADAVWPLVSVPPPQDTAAPEPFAQRSTEERAAAVKHTLAAFIDWGREGVTEQLVRQGLSQEDAARMAERFIEGYADCTFDAVRKQYEARGVSMSEFLDRAEQGWSHVLDGYDVNRVLPAFVPCVANLSQQTGISMPADDASAGSREELNTPPPPPPWAAEMESRIRNHVASRPGLGVTNVLVDCREEGCNVILVGQDIPVFDFDFDVFAEQNGFERAVLRGTSNHRLVWLKR
jgi:hypothetical protein